MLLILGQPNETSISSLTRINFSFIYITNTPPWQSNKRANGRPNSRWLDRKQLHGQHIILRTQRVRTPYHETAAQRWPTQIQSSKTNAIDDHHPSAMPILQAFASTAIASPRPGQGLHLFLPPHKIRENTLNCSVCRRHLHATLFGYRSTG